jgi:TP901 family phage tail tape measure protein
MADFGILAKIGVDASQMSKGLNKAKSDVDGFGKRIGTAVKAGVLVAGAAIAAMATKGVSDFMDFEKKMAEVFTLMPGMTREAEGKMTADMRNLAKTMGVDLIDATNALYQAISAGVDPDNAVTFLETASKAAIAGVADLETSVGALTVIMNGYAMEASQAEEISDVLFSTVAIGVTTFDKLGRNIGKVVPLAASLGITIQEVGAMFAVLTQTMSTAEAGTQIRAMLAELSKEGQKAFEFFKEASGKTFPDFIKQGGTVTDALRILTDHSKTTGKGMIDMFGGIEAGMGALTLAADNADVLADALKEIQGGSGSMIVAFERMKKTSAHQMNVMKRNFEDLGITMGAALLPFVNAVLPALTRAFEMLAEGVLAVTGFISEHPEIFKQLGKMLKVVAAGIVAYNAGLLLLAIRSAAAAVGTNLMAIATAVMSGSMAKLNATMKVNPFLLIVGAVAMVVTAFKMWGDAADEAGERSAQASKRAMDKYQQLIDAAIKGAQGGNPVHAGHSQGNGTRDRKKGTYGRGRFRLGGGPEAGQGKLGGKRKAVAHSGPEGKGPSG